MNPSRPPRTNSANACMHDATMKRPCENGAPLSSDDFYPRSVVVACSIFLARRCLVHQNFPC